jgi:Domain of Unknown Function (DUF1543)
MEEQKLFMVLVGATPKGRYTEQHDVFFGIGDSLASLIPAIEAFWPEANGRAHIDAWREVTYVDGYAVRVRSRGESAATATNRLYFINLGGYKPGEFEEYHYKTIIAGPDKGAAVRRSKETTFYKHIGFKGAESHIDDKYGIDVDDAHEIADILPAGTKGMFALEVVPSTGGMEDELNIGYVQLEKLRKKSAN